MARPDVHPLGFGAALLVVGALAYVDSGTGEHFHFSVLYLIPVVMVALQQGRTATVAISLIATLAVLSAELGWRQQWDARVWAWNGFTHLVIFLAVGVALVRARRREEDLRNLNTELNRVAEREALLARTDALTGLSNLRYFTERVGFEVDRALRYGHSLALAYVDLDDFKLVNDRFGHAAGDRVLRGVADAIRANVRSTDIPARLGGDEFAVLFTEVDSQHAQHVGERLVADVGKMTQELGSLRLGASVGIAYFDRPPRDPSDVIRCADAAMYSAKSSGKGRLTVQHNPPVPPREGLPRHVPGE